MVQQAETNRSDELDDAYHAVFGNLGNPEVALVVNDLMSQGGVLSSAGAMQFSNEQIRAQAGAHDLVIRILHKAGLTREPRRLMRSAREASRAKTEGQHGR